MLLDERSASSSDTLSIITRQIIASSLDYRSEFPGVLAKHLHCAPRGVRSRTQTLRLKTDSC